MGVAELVDGRRVELENEPRRVEPERLDATGAVKLAIRRERIHPHRMRRPMITCST